MMAVVATALVTLPVLLVVSFRDWGNRLLDRSIADGVGVATGRLRPQPVLRRARASRRAYGFPGLALVLLTLALALPTGASAFISTGDGVWVWQNPLPQGNDLKAVAFSDAAHGWAVGYGGTILATTDGGANWRAQSSGSTSTLWGVAFSDAAHGWAVGTSGAILATSDGGATWSEQNLGGTEYLYDVAFADATHGWAVGGRGAILATADGGATWSAQTSGFPSDRLRGVAFSDATHGCAVGTGGLILVTTDGGTTWNLRNSGIHGDLFGVAFTDATHGWAVGSVGVHGEAGVILATTDGGTTWGPQTTESREVFSGVVFRDAIHGWVATSGGGILATADGGVTWSAQSSGSTEDLSGVALGDATHAWAVGASGTIVATSNGGATWGTQSSGSTEWITGVAFPDAAHGWAVGAGGTILATSNGGTTWGAQSSGTSQAIRGVAFPDATHGWAVGARGTIVATADGGTTWRAQSSGTAAYLYAVAFPDATHGWAVGYGGTILATTDGGSTWNAQNSGTSVILHGIAFTDATHGWVVGDQRASTSHGTILATADGGATWSEQSSGSTSTLWGVAFSDATHGWAVGTGGTIVATIDGGANWSAQSSGSSTTWLTDVAFSDAVHGWAVGDGGTILATTDRGSTWSRENSGNGGALYAVAFPDAAHGWAVGTGGAILATVGGSPPPTVSGFAPASGPVGTLVTIDGLNLTGITGVAFNGTPAVFFDEVTPTRIRAIVPAGATTGTISATTAGGTGVSADAFAVTVPPPIGPVITGFGPTSGPVGTVVTISGTGFDGATVVEFVHDWATPITVSPTQVTAAVPVGAWTGRIGVTTLVGTGISADDFRVVPTVTGISPSSGSTAGGTIVTITGMSFAGVTGVSFGTTPAVSFAHVSSTSLTATSPAGTGTVDVTVTSAAGTSAIVAAGRFTYLVLPDPPTISGFSPTAGPVGTPVTLTGTGFTDASVVEFVHAEAAFNVDSDTQITLTVPAGALTGPITVHAPGGDVTSTAEFTVGPTVKSFTPTSGPVGTVVTIDGLNLTDITGVTFHDVSAARFEEITPKRIRAVVPHGATTGPIGVTTAGGTGVSASVFIVTTPGPTPGPTPEPAPTPTPGPSGPSVIPATGGTGIASSTALTGGSGAWTTLSGPTITEGGIGAWPIGERITLALPANFGWNPARTAPLTVSGCDRTATAITYSGDGAATVTLAARLGASQLGACTISFGATLQVRPLNSASSAGTGGQIALTFINPTLPMPTVVAGGAGQVSMVVSETPVSSLSLAATSPLTNNHAISWGEFVDLVTTGPSGAGFSLQVTIDDPAATSSPSWETLTTSAGGPLTFTIGSGGTSTYRYTPIRNYWYRAIAGPTTSNTLRVTVRQTIAVRPQNTGTQTISTGRTITFTATVRPARPELQKAVVVFELYRRSGSSWVLDRTTRVTIDSNGIATWAWTASSTGRVYVRAQARPTPANANSFWSPSQSYEVS